MDIFRTLIVTASDATLARKIATSFGPGGEGMWTTPLSSDGQKPTTHYISSGYIPEQFVTLLEDPLILYETVTSQGVVCTLEEVEAVLSSSDISEEPPFVAMARLGIQIIQTEEL